MGVLIEYVKNVQVESEYQMIATYGMNLGQMLSIPFILIGGPQASQVISKK